MDRKYLKLPAINLHYGSMPCCKHISQSQANLQLAISPAIILSAASREAQAAFNLLVHRNHVIKCFLFEAKN
jgi:hypothetical protein